MLGIAIICFAGAMFSKEVAFGLPLLLVLHDRIFYRKIVWRSILPLAAIAFAYLLARAVALPKLSTSQLALNYGSLLQCLDYFTGYVRMLLLPLDIPLYIAAPAGQVGHVAWGLALLVLAAGLTALVKKTSGARKSALLFAIAWTVVFLWPAVVLAFYGKGFYAARFLYLPSMGLAMLCTIALAWAIEAWPRLKPAMAGCVLAILCMYLFLDSRELGAWKDNAAIYSKVIAANPAGYTGHLGLASDAMEREDYVLAEKQFQMVLTSDPTAADRVVTLNNLGTIAGMAQRMPASEQYFKTALHINPQSSEAWNGLGNLAWIRGDAQEAVRNYEKAYALKPNNYQAAANLATAYEQVGLALKANEVRQLMAAEKSGSMVKSGAMEKYR